MTQSFFIPGPLPGLNTLLDEKSRKYRGSPRLKGKVWNGYANMKRQQGEAVCWELLRQKIKPMKRVVIRFIWRELDRTRDPDNFTAGGRKIIFDSLVKAGILKNDGWAQIVGWQDRWEVETEKPGVLVEMEDV